MADVKKKKCVMCHKVLYDMVQRCPCGSHDFFSFDEKEITIDDGLSNIYVLLPDGTKSYINKLIVHVFRPKVGGSTSSGYPIMQDESIAKV